MKSIILNFDGTCNDPEDAGDFLKIRVLAIYLNFMHFLVAN
jgi:hypothetical protein